MLLGHEAAGLVEAVGAGVGDLRVGQRVVITFLARCGECEGCDSGGRLPCQRGSSSNAAGEMLDGGTRLTNGAEPIRQHLGVSAFASHAVVDRRSVVPVDHDVPPVVAALIGCAVLTGGGALLNDAGVTPDMSVAVVGLGGVGMAGLLTAVAIGCTSVIGIDSKPEKLGLARELGATQALTPAEALESGVRADVVLEAVGRSSAFETAFAVTAMGGTLVTVGLPATSDLARISPLRITAEALRIVGSYMGSAIPSRDVPRFVDLWRSGKFPLERLVTRSIHLDQLNEAMDALADADALRQVVTPHHEEH